MRREIERCDEWRPYANRRARHGHDPIVLDGVKRVVFRDLDLLSPFQSNPEAFLPDDLVGVPSDNTLPRYLERLRVDRESFILVGRHRDDICNFHNARAAPPLPKPHPRIPSHTVT